MTRGQPDAQALALIESVGRRAFAYAWQMLHNHEDALDAVQAAMVAVWRSRRRLNPERDVRAWFFCVLRNRCIDQLRTRRARGPGAAAVEPAADAADDPAQRATRSEDQARLRLELECLPEQMREIILLRDYHDLSYAEIARVLEIPSGTVMSRLHRARATLRERMLADG
ncbi:MAG: sigma-70 family RNA polymerase sigma factor [Planctomycetes bacterium]|nr:sigma-70 family RNA polymerase sigma factor [Planctomycetota bacterium]